MQKSSSYNLMVLEYLEMLWLVSSSRTSSHMMWNESG
jgi:hypothetical protein